MLGLAKFLTVRERRRFESISTSWEFIPNTNPGLPATVALGHLWYNSGTYFTGSISAAQLGTLHTCHMLHRVHKYIAIHQSAIKVITNQVQIK